MHAFVFATVLRDHRRAKHLNQRQLALRVDALALLEPVDEGGVAAFAAEGAPGGFELADDGDVEVGAEIDVGADVRRSSQKETFSGF